MFEEPSPIPSQADSPRLRVAIVSPEVGVGAGVPHYWHALAMVMAQNHEVHVFTARADRASLPGVTVHRLPVIVFGWFLLHATFYAAVLTRFALARLFRRPRFDLVLGIGALTPFADVATVHFVQARELELQNKGLFPPERPAGGLASIDYALYSHTMGWLGRNFYRHSQTRIVAISAAVKRDLVQFEGASASAIAVVPNGIDIERFHPVNRLLLREDARARLNLAPHEAMVLFVGNSWGRKGLRTVMGAIQGHGLDNVRLVVVGEGSERSYLEGLPPQVASRVTFAGRNQLDVERFYAAADVFMLPTLYEPFGLVVLEAMASGVPAIVSACAGASEWLVDGLDAVLLQDPTDIDEARAALGSVLSDPGFAASLSANGRAKAETLQWSNVADHMIAAFYAARSPEPALPPLEPALRLPTESS